MLQNVPYFEIIPPNFICKCWNLHCRRIVPTLFPQRGNNRAANSRPYERSEITPAVIQWHSPCRGGYYPPANVASFWAETYWPGDVTMLRIFHVSTLYRRISLYNVRYCIVGALRRRCFPVGETTGRILSAPTPTEITSL